MLTRDSRILLRSHPAAVTPSTGARVIGWSDKVGARIRVEPSVDGRYLFGIAEPRGRRVLAIRSTAVERALPLFGPILTTLPLFPWAMRRSPGG